MWEQEIVVGSYMSIIIATLDCGSLTQWVEIMSNRVHRHFFFFFLFCCSGNVANSSSSSLIRDKPTTASKKKKEKKNYESKMSHQQCRALWGIIIIIIIITQFIVRISDLQKFTNFFFFSFWVLVIISSRGRGVDPVILNYAIPLRQQPRLIEFLLPIFLIVIATSFCLFRHR